MRLLRRRNAPMNCMEVARNLQRYLDGDIDDAKARRLEAHLEDCRRCGMEAHTYQHIKTSLAARGTGPVPDDAIERLTRFARSLTEHTDHDAP